MLPPDVTHAERHGRDRARARRTCEDQSSTVTVDFWSAAVSHGTFWSPQSLMTVTAMPARSTVSWTRHGAMHRHPAQGSPQYDRAHNGPACGITSRYRLGPSPRERASACRCQLLCRARLFLGGVVRNPRWLVLGVRVRRCRRGRGRSDQIHVAVRRHACHGRFEGVRLEHSIAAGMRLHELLQRLGARHRVGNRLRPRRLGARGIGGRALRGWLRGQELGHRERLLDGRREVRRNTHILQMCANEQ